jgi:hypothetical protein
MRNRYVNTEELPPKSKINRPLPVLDIVRQLDKIVAAYASYYLDDKSLGSPPRQAVERVCMVVDVHGRQPLICGWGAGGHEAPRWRAVAREKWE